MDSVLPTFAGLQLASMHEQQRGANGGRGPGRPRHNSQADVLTDEDPVVWLNRYVGKCRQGFIQFKLCIPTPRASCWRGMAGRHLPCSWKSRVVTEAPVPA